MYYRTQTVNWPEAEYLSVHTAQEKWIPMNKSGQGLTKKNVGKCPSQKSFCWKQADFKSWQ